MTVFKMGESCTFCKYYYNSTNQYIRPQDSKNGIWKFETTTRYVYLKCNFSKGADMCFKKFENK